MAARQLAATSTRATAVVPRNCQVPDHGLWAPVPRTTKAYRPLDRARALSFGHQCPNKGLWHRKLRYFDGRCGPPSRFLIPHQITESAPFRPPPDLSCHAGGRGCESRRFAEIVLRKREVRRGGRNLSVPRQRISILGLVTVPA